MYRYRWTPALLLMVLFAMQSTASNAEPAIGVAASIKPNAESVVGETSQTLSPGSELRANETVRTGNRGQADLVFIDNTNLTVGPTSEVLLDKFVYDPTGSSGKVVLNATRGTFRFVTGTQDHRVYAVKTPYGTLGVRGTVVEMKVLPNMVRKVAQPGECVVTIRLVEGAGVTFTTSAGVVHRANRGRHAVAVLRRHGHWKMLQAMSSAVCRGGRRRRRHRRHLEAVAQPPSCVPQPYLASTVIRSCPKPEQSRAISHHSGLRLVAIGAPIVVLNACKGNGLFLDFAYSVKAGSTINH